MIFMSLYSLSVLGISITERNSVAWIVASEEKPAKAVNDKKKKKKKYINEKRMVKTCIVFRNEILVKQTD